MGFIKNNMECDFRKFFTDAYNMNYNRCFNIEENGMTFYAYTL